MNIHGLKNKLKETRDKLKYLEKTGRLNFKLKKRLKGQMASFRRQIKFLRETKAQNKKMQGRK